MFSNLKGSSISTLVKGNGEGFAIKSDGRFLFDHQSGGKTEEVSDRGHGITKGRGKVARERKEKPRDILSNSTLLQFTYRCSKFFFFFPEENESLSLISFPFQ